MELAQTDNSYCAATTPARDVRDATLDTKEEENAIDKGAKSPISEFFPWVPELRKMCRIIYEDFNTTSLIELMRFYVRNITNSMSECYTKPSWAIRLKESISETLVLFLYIYRALSEKCDRYIYLNYMSDLLAIYIDMELKASRKTKEDQGIICARITSCLHVYLEHSIEHLLDTLIKVQFMCRSYHAILDPIVTKVIRSIPTHPESSVMYVRYLLIYRLWRKINGDATARSKINAAAIAALGPPPTFPCSLDSVLPKVPKHQPNPLKFLLFRKFDTKRTCELFVQFCKRNERIYQEEDQQAEEKRSATPCSSDKCDNAGKDVDVTRNNLESFDNNVNSNVAVDKISSSESSPNPCKTLNSRMQSPVKALGSMSNNNCINRVSPKVLNETGKSCSSRRKLNKSGKVIVIDLTTDVELEKCCIMKKKSFKKPAWLEEAKKTSLKIKRIKQKKRWKKRRKSDDIAASFNKEESQTSCKLQNLRSPTAATTVTTGMNVIASDVERKDAKIDSAKFDLTPPLFSKKLGDLCASMSPKDRNDSSTTTETQTLIAKNNKNFSRSCTPEATANTFSVKVQRHSDDDNNSALDSGENDTVSDRLKEAVIKRLIDKEDAALMSEEEIRRCARGEVGEKDDKICDLMPESSPFVNNIVEFRCNSKDETNSLTFNRNVLLKCDGAGIQAVKLSHEDEGNTSEVRDLRAAAATTTTKSDHVEVSENRDAAAFEVTLECSSSSSSNEINDATVRTSNISKSSIICAEELKDEQMSCAANEVIKRNGHAADRNSQRNAVRVLQRENPLNNTVSFSIMNGDDSDVQAEVEIEHCIEGNEDAGASKSTSGETKARIFAENFINTSNNSSTNSSNSSSSTQVKTNNDSGDKATRDNEATKQNAKIICENGDNTEHSGESGAKNEGANSSRIKGATSAAAGLDPKTSKVNARKDLRDTEEKTAAAIKGSGKSGKEKNYVIHNTGLQENMDGLSLLASVSQHVPHLKAELELAKYEHIKVKDYATLRKTSCCDRRADEEETDNTSSDSLNAMSRLYENPSAEVINQIVGVYPENALQRIALHVEVTTPSNENRNNNANSKAAAAAAVHVPPPPLGLECSSTNYETSEAFPNIVLPIESNIQSAKENTNVILNGETVVLLQKSPNSNLYIINKAVENAKDYNSDDEANNARMMEKSWLIPPMIEDCAASFELINNQDHVSSFGNIDMIQYTKEQQQSYQEKCPVLRNKIIKLEPKEDSAMDNLAEEKLYSKKGALRNEMLSSGQAVTFQDASTPSNKGATDKRASSKTSILAYRQNIKQEYNSLSNHVASNCPIQGCTAAAAALRSHPRVENVDNQHSLHIPVSHPTAALPGTICGSCSATTDLCLACHKHCTSVSCALQINAPTSLRSRANSGSPCGRSHCSSCLNCTYDIIAHCRQCIHPPTAEPLPRVSCIESNSYFLPSSHSSVQTPSVQDHERTKKSGESVVIGKLYDEKILCKIEQNLLQTGNALEKSERKVETDKLNNKRSSDSKLPLKKRLKAQHAMMSMVYEDISIKSEKLDNYPAIPMMSIAALEALDNTQNQRTTQIIKPAFELPPPSARKEDLHSGYHLNSNLVRRDYRKEVHDSSSHHSNHPKDSPKKYDCQSNNSTAIYRESCHQRSSFKAATQCKEIEISDAKQLASEVNAEDDISSSSYKKAKKSSTRKTRSSKRNVPKVNYSYSEIDSEWIDPSGVLKRKRRKSSR